MKRALALLAAAGLAAAAMSPAVVATGAVLAAVTPAYSDALLISASTTPPTELQCYSAGRRCFTPQSMANSYNYASLLAGGNQGQGKTIAVVDSFGSDTIAHDLHVFDQAFGVQSMCGEEGVTCTACMPSFSVLSLQGSPATKAPSSKSNGTGLQDRAAWALEVSLDVETAHAIAPMANILLVTTPVPETLGVQGLPQMMAAEQYVIDNHLAQVISQSFASAEDAFASTQSLLNLRHAFQAAAANGVTVLGASGDNGTANTYKQPIKNPRLIPYPTVEWPASDPLVTGVGGTYLCTNPTAGTNDPRTIYAGPAGRCNANPTQAEVGWTFSGGGFSDVFAKPAYQNSLPAGPNTVGAMRGVPDVAFQASAGTGALVYLSLPPDGLSGLACDNAGTPCSTGWYDIGGTSISTPQWAGLIAIADQINGGGLGLINPGLYKIGADSTRYANDFFDVTTGNNTADPTVP